MGFLLAERRILLRGKLAGARWASGEKKCIKGSERCRKGESDSLVFLRRIRRHWWPSYVL